MGCYGDGGYLQNTPNFNAWIATAWGAGGEYWSSRCAAFFGAATNLVFGVNPPYFLDNFLAIYPKFFGLPTPLSGCSVAIGTSAITVSNANGLNYGQFVQAPGVLPPGSVIVGLAGNVVTVNTSALATNANFTLATYQQPPIPVGVVLLYMNLANASLVQARWQEMWLAAMGLYIAHFLTLYAKSDESTLFETLATAVHGETPVGAVPGTVYTLSAAPPGGSLQSLTKNGGFLVPGPAYTLVGATVTLAVATVLDDVLYATWPIQVQTFASSAPNGASIAAQGLAGGVQVAKSVGDVSVSYQPLEALADWAAWGLTSYGQILATFARSVGQGPMVIY